MYCSRCGAPSDKGAKYCAACGAALQNLDDDSGTGSTEPLGVRLRRLFGTTRAARRLSIATVIAIGVGVVAFVFLPTNDDGSGAPPQDAYTVSTDRVCVAEKQRIAAAAKRAPKGDVGANANRYAAALVAILEEWRLSLTGTPPPPDRTGLVLALDSALRETMAQAGTLARLAPRAGQKPILAQAAAVDAASSRVEQAIAALGLRKCANLGVGAGQLISR